MTAALWLLGGLLYLAVGVGLARLRAWQVMRHHYVRDELQTEMLLMMFLWPALAPCYLLAWTICRVLFPRRLR